jgi:antitoxin component HigA of HigAB toxin-antitoxin module
MKKRAAAAPLANRTARRSKVPAAVAALPKSFLALMAEYPFRPIRTAADYDRAARIELPLAQGQAVDDAGEASYLEVLEALVDRYDAAVGRIDTTNVTPTQVLRALVEQAGMTVTELGQLLGSKGAASELLSGRRKEPSKAQIARLCARFKVDAGVFLLPLAKPANAA